MDYDIAEIRLADYCRNQRVQHITHQGRNNLAESRADNHRNGQVHYITAENKISKSLEHPASNTNETVFRIMLSGRAQIGE